ncbi:hypothetical protein PF007_g20170 [Phytophthora fragariae]|uniref:Protein kinase domain-containing protein n=1 Tax=Phytophthora fragariae TaxID=53985 RepID=A0A6A4BXG2_9STRA|nr:hypothetical protein PF007_g20170 [Phytophthora fragariae]KAE9180179.1 hypothetical protein PF004_g24917 [Phytophthora fragariae]KAE9278028.1 hypothetical protein PF001_g25360 [Phytophthora fragariae]
MSSVMNVLAIPEAGKLVDVLSRTKHLAADMNEAKDACTRLHLRLKDVFDELVKMERNNSLPENDELDKFVATVTKYLRFLEQHRGKKLVGRLLNHVKMIRELDSINQDVDMVFKLYSIANSATVKEWKKQWEEALRTQKEAIASVAANNETVLREFPDKRSQLDAVFTVKFEMGYHAEHHDKEVTRLMRSLVSTILRVSKMTVDKLPRWFLPRDELKFEPEPFARGSFGHVHRGGWKSEVVVVKQYFVTDLAADDAAIQKLEAEMNLWYQFDHVNVIKLFAASHVGLPLFIVSEFAAKGDLGTFLTRSKKNKKHMWRLLYEAAQGLDFLHRKSVVHGSLKLKNILVGSDRTAKLSDLGLSAVRTSVVAVDTGDLRWRAPESLKNKPTFASDVYSFAMCIIEAVTGKFPFGSLDEDNVHKRIQNGEIPDKPKRMPDEAWELIVSMTNYTPNRRPVLEGVLEKLKKFAAKELSMRPKKEKIDTSAKAIKSEDPVLTTPVQTFASSSATVDLLKAIVSGTEDERNEALLVLVQRCTDSEQRDTAVESNGVEVLTGLARNDRNYFTQLYALECLKWCATTDVLASTVSELEGHIRGASEQELTSVVNGLKVTSDDENLVAVVRCACMAIADNCEKLQRVGVIPLLVKLMQTESESIKLWAAEAVRYLASGNEKCRPAIAMNGGIEPLVTLTTTGTPLQKCVAALALGNLARSKVVSEAVVRKGAIPPLIELVHSGTDSQKLVAAQTIGVIASSNSAEILRHNGIPPLVGLLREGTNELEESAAFALEALSENKDAVDVMTREGAIKQLIALLREGSDKMKTIAVRVLAKLTIGGESRVEMMREQIIPPLIALLRGVNAEQKAPTVDILGVLATYDSIRPEMVREGIIPPLIALIQSEPKMGIGLLEKLANSPDSHAAILSGGAISALTGILRTGTEDEKSAAIRVLGSVYTSGACSDEFIREGVIRQLANLLQSQTEHHKELTLRTLNRLASNDDVSAEIGRLGAIPSFVAVLQSGSDSQKTNAVGILDSLARKGKCGLDIAREGAILALIQLIQAGSEGQTTAATNLLNKLAMPVGNRDEIVRRGAIPPLGELLNNGTEEQKASALETLTSLVATCSHVVEIALQEKAPSLPWLGYCEMGRKSNRQVQFVCWEVLRLLILYMA